ncbi:(deoxy)nucleoside triphosphate pyrophosphohydrolase [Thalassoglobus sp. JC818]|uniref:(deoxy)nucleoside triphosphate pyrophosphohydrolase n=1 Tax=Thalassoglobus sp. JC818 TaxID=3232136 RepID=UPI003459F2D7
MNNTQVSPKPPISIGIAVVQHDNKVLVGKRPENSHLAGLSEFPGGKADPQESPAACAIRECLEETGLRIDVDSLLHRHTHHYPDRSVDLSFFLCKLQDPDESTSLRAPFEWVPFMRLSELTFPEGNQEVLQILHDRMSHRDHIA